MSVATYATTEWMLDAVCLGIPDFTELPIAEQVSICRKTQCPVRLQCLEYGIAQRPATASSTVVYGGIYPSELVRISSGRHRATEPHMVTCDHCGAEFEGRAGRGSAGAGAVWRRGVASRWGCGSRRLQGGRTVNWFEVFGVVA